MSEFIKVMVNTIDQKIGDKPFYSVRELVTSGVFGSLSSVRRALQAGQLTHVKISQRRYVVPRFALLEYLRKNMSKNGEGYAA